LEAAWFQPLKLNCDFLDSKFAFLFEFNLYRYTKDAATGGAAEAAAAAGKAVGRVRAGLRADLVGVSEALASAAAVSSAPTPIAQAPASTESPESPESPESSLTDSTDSTDDASPPSASPESPPSPPRTDSTDSTDSIDATAPPPRTLSDATSSDVGLPLEWVQQEAILMTGEAPTQFRPPPAQQQRELRPSEDDARQTDGAAASSSSGPASEQLEVGLYKLISVEIHSLNPPGSIP
jgi:hypothetical protein